MIRPTFSASSCALCLALCLAASGSVAAPVRTATGTVDVARADRIVALDVPALDTLTALGVAPVGAPDRLYVDYLDSLAQATPDVGTLFEPDLEALALLDPDLIIVGGRSAANSGALAQIAQVIDMTIGPDVVAEARARLDAYGSMLGKQERAAALTADLDARLARLADAGQAAAAGGGGRAMIVLTNGAKMSAYGKGSRFGWIFGSTGLAEAAPGLKVDTHGAAISHEFIAEVNPDWLFVIDRGVAVGENGLSARDTLDTPLVRGTNAWKNGHVVYLDPAPLYIAGGGYTALSRGIDQLTEALAR